MSKQGMNSNLQQVHSKRRAQRLQQVIFVCLLLTGFVLVGWLAILTQQEWDMSREQRHSLTKTSIELLQQLDSEIEFMAFMGNNPGRREQVRDLIGQYQKHNSNIKLNFIDPNLRPDLTREFGIKRDGEIRLSVKKLGEENSQSELLREISETGISNALLRLSRASQRHLVFIEGHAERNPFGKANHDLRQFATELANKGYDLQRFDISQQPLIPNNTRILVIASPQLNYLPQEIERIKAYIKTGGNLLWLSDPDGLKGLETLLDEFGLASPNGVVIDQGTQELGIADASFSLVSNYNQHPALQNFDLVSLFPQARTFQAITSDDASADSTTWEKTSFLVTAERTWLETQELQDSVSFDPKSDTQGPLNIGYSLVRDIGEVGAKTQQRIIIIGDGDFLSNRFLNNGANLPLGLNLMDWLSGEESFLNLRFTDTPDIQLNMSDKTLAIIGLIFLFLIPFLCFFIALRIWWKRRNS